MNLFFRLLRIFLGNLFSNDRIGLLDPSELSFRVWLTDQDMFAHMTNSRYLSFSDLGTINYILKSGSWGPLRKNGWHPVICGQTMFISRMLSTPQKFTLVSRIVGWDDTYVGLLHEFVRNGEVATQVKVIARFVSRDRKRVAPIDMVNLVEPGADNPGLDQDFQDLIDRMNTARANRQKTTSRQS